MIEAFPIRGGFIAKMAGNPRPYFGRTIDEAIDAAIHAVPG